jgi:membrane protease YdiL (CAAX protease family)
MGLLKGVGAIVLGLTIALVGGLVWSVLLGVNLSTTPSAPWAAPVMLLILGLGWLYLSGWGWPRATQAARAVRLPQRALVGGQWFWAVAAGVLVMAASLCALLVAFRLLPIPISPLPDSARAAPLIAAAYFGVGSLVAGMVEEAAFRGYMQSGVQRVWGKAASFAIVALAFAALHAGNPEFFYLIPLYFATSLALSFLVDLSGSLWPGVIAHTLADIASFLLLLTLGAEALGADANLSAPDSTMMLVIGIGAASLILTPIAYWRLAVLMRSNQSGA